MQQENNKVQELKQPQQYQGWEQKKLNNTDIQQHHDSCACILCQKQHQISQMRKLRTKMHFQSIYKNDFVSKKSKNKKSHDKQIEQNRRERRQKSLIQMPTYNMGYLQLQSTYNNDFVSKKIEISKIRPMDQLGTLEGSLPISTTYKKSYQSTLTPKPDDPFKRTEQPVGLAIPFSSQSVYQKAYKKQHSPRPNLPFIHRQNISKPRSIGTFESTQKHSYSTMILNPEDKNIDQMILKQPSSNLVNLSSFSHNYDTTYRNFFVGATNRSHYKHDIDQIGNVNRRLNNLYKF